MAGEVKDRNNIPKLLRELEKAKERALKEIGAEGERVIKETITRGRGEWPPLKTATTARKGSSKPLIDEGIMRAKVTSRAEKDSVRIGLFGDDDSGKRSGRETVEIGLVHEFGSQKAGVPMRPFIRPSFDEEIAPEAEKIIAEKINEAIRRSKLSGGA